MLQIQATAIVSARTQDPNPGPEGARWQVSARFWKQTEVGGVTKAEGSGIVSSNPRDGGDKGTRLTHRGSCSHFPIACYISAVVKTSNDDSVV